MNTLLQRFRVPWDIETGPQSIEAIKRIAGDFDPTKLKLSKYKKLETKNQKIEEARASYETDLLSKACLNPLFGRVMAIGFINELGERHIIDAQHDEKAALAQWFSIVVAKRHSATFIGWNTFGFDNPFIRQRALLLGLPLPASWYQMSYSFRPRWDNQLDLMLEFTGNVQQYAALNDVARAFGHSGKNGDGAEFHKLWTSPDPAVRKQAGEYLLNDLDMTAFTGDCILGKLEPSSIVQPDEIPFSFQDSIA